MRMKLVMTLALLLVGCGQAKKGGDAAPPPQQTPQASPPAQEDPFDTKAREAEIIQKYKDIGITLTFWEGQKPELRDVELQQMTDLLPEIQKRTSYVTYLEISPYKMHWYEAKRLKVALEGGVDAAVTYLGVFDKVRAYESRLNGTLLERAGETTEILEADLNFYDRVDLAGLLANKPFIKVVHPSGALQFYAKTGRLYVRQDMSAADLSSRLEGFGRWHQLSVDLGIEIEDQTQDLLYDSFISAVDALQAQVDLIRPVLDLIKKIEIIREAGETTFDLESGVVSISRFDVQNSGADLWTAFAYYKTAKRELAIDIEIPDYLRRFPDELRDALKFVVDQIDVIRPKLGRIRGLRIGMGEQSQMGANGVLLVGSQSTPDEFRAFIEAL